MIRKIKVVQNPKLFQVKLEYNHLEQIAGLCDEAAVFFVTKKLSSDMLCHLSMTKQNLI